MMSIGIFHSSQPTAGTPLIWMRAEHGQCWVLLEPPPPLSLLRRGLGLCFGWKEDEWMRDCAECLAGQLGGGWVGHKEATWCRTQDLHQCWCPRDEFWREEANCGDSHHGNLQFASWLRTAHNLSWEHHPLGWHWNNERTMRCLMALKEMEESTTILGHKVSFKPTVYSLFFNHI